MEMPKAVPLQLSSSGKLPSFSFTPAFLQKKVSAYLYLCVCVYVCDMCCVCVCVYLYVCTCVYMCVRVRVCTCMCVYMCVHYVCTIEFSVNMFIGTSTYISTSALNNSAHVRYVFMCF